MRRASEADATLSQALPDAAMPVPLLALEGIRREFTAGDTVIAVLRGIDLEVMAARWWPSWASRARASPR